MVVQDKETGFLLKCTDEAAKIVESLVALLSSWYESEISSEGGGSNMMVGTLSIHSVGDLYRMLSELLAKLWPCDKRFVALIGPTGCGKSTLLNLLISMTSKTGEEYKKGMKLDESRAVLRDTVIEHGVGLKKGADHGEENLMEGNDESSERSSTGSVAEDLFYTSTLDLQPERTAMCGLLGLCCSQDRSAYLDKHMALYDRYPFLLQSGRMGDAGTTKVMALQWGPKFAARIQWVSRAKLRKRWRELRSFIDNTQSSERTANETLPDALVLKVKESRELWESMLRTVGHIPSNRLPTPTEELIESTLKQLAKKVPLGEKQIIETSSTHGCVIDRLYVRDGIRKRLCEEKLGLLVEDLVMEAPIPSSEGGVSLLDVPGTNDPRFLHQRETRDAIDRTSLILLVVDKSVVDASTEKILEESTVLERMLLDNSQRCNLVVVGIAEKRCKSGQLASDCVAQFDPKQDLRKALKRVFLKKIRSLISSRRLDREEAKRRLNNIFEDNRFSVLPVLPLLCASLHLSASNPILHRNSCESSGAPTCPLVMNAAERMKSCLQTNIPELLEMIQSVRVPSSRVKLKSYLESALATLKIYTKESEYDQSMIKFFDRERKHGERMAKEPCVIEARVPDNAIDMGYIVDKLSSYSQQCILSDEDLKYLRLKLEPSDSLKAGNTVIDQDLSPVLMRGFRPELIGKIARELIQPTEDKASLFVTAVYKHMNTRRKGKIPWRENHFDKVSENCMGSCVALHGDIQTQWKHTLERILARCTCGGADGGLQKVVRGALRKACDTTFKSAITDMRKQKRRRATTSKLLIYLEQFEFGEKVKKAASREIEKHLHGFWNILKELIKKTVSELWSAWIRQLLSLKESVEQTLNNETKISSKSVPNKPADKNLRVSLLNKISELEVLCNLLETHNPLVDGDVKYGYSLLHNNPCYETELGACREKPTIDIETSSQDERPDIVRASGSEAGPSQLRRVISNATSVPKASLPTIAEAAIRLSESNLKRNRGAIALEECEAHNLYLSNHGNPKQKKGGGR